MAFTDTGSSRGAAWRKHKTDSAVSRHLVKLARAVGCTLVRRGGRRLVPTADGEALLRHAGRILSAHDEAVGFLLAPVFHGQFPVGLPDDCVPVLMGPLLQGLQRVVWVAVPGLGQNMPACVALALVQEGCSFRKWALARLRQRRRAHRVVCSSRSMLAIQAAVRCAARRRGAGIRRRI